MTDIGRCICSYAKQLGIHDWVGIGFRVPAASPEEAEHMIKSQCGHILRRDYGDRSFKKKASWALRNHFEMKKVCELTEEGIQDHVRARNTVWKGPPSAT